MRRAHRLALVSLFCLVSVAASAPAAAQTPTMEEPKEGGIFRVNPATGALMPLESIWSKVQYAGRTYYCYLPGAESPTTFPLGEPHMFAVRLLGPPTLEEQRKQPTYKLEQLAVKDGKRYGTKNFIPLDVTSYGQIVYGLDANKKRNRGALTFLFTTRQALPPGEYAFSISGLITPYAGFGADPTFANAFRIVEAPAATPQAIPPPPPVRTTTNSAAAIQPVRTAAEQGDAAAQFKLGEAYATGTGVPQDYAQAAGWLRKAAAQGSADAQYGLGVMYRDGMGFPQDPAQEFLFFGKAAEQGHAAAQANLGNLYFLGRGVLQDYVDAHKWLNLATARLTGDAQQQSAGLRDQVAGRMTPTQVADAQKRAREWMEAFERRRP